jgi:transcriptional regulator with XRE-family HTH domain
MAINQDFSWAEVGERIRVRRTNKQLSQQALAEAAGLTQNGIFRVEAGETNPQLSTLQCVAGALGCSVRELLIGKPEVDSDIGKYIKTIRRILESQDREAIGALKHALTTAELLVERGGIWHGPVRVVIKGDMDSVSPRHIASAEQPGHVSIESGTEPALATKQRAGLVKKAHGAF